ncbi:MAG: F0F1 ATP synthase subunit epsilon [Gammaproteobacteria bacterium]
MSTIQVKIISAEKNLYEGKATLVVVTAALGELGILPNHAPMLADLKPGQVRLHQEDTSELVFYVSGGIVEVQPQLIIILADSAARAENVDEASAVAAKARAEQLLSNQNSDIDYAVVRAELAQALAQIAALERARKLLK